MPHAVTGITNPDGLISASDQRLSYTSFNKADSIIQNNYIYTLKYGHQDQRTISKLFSNGTLQKTVYYAGNFEKEVIAGIPYPKNIHYIYGGDGLAAIYTTQSSNSDMYYVHKDHLGSIDKITNSSKIVIQKTSFDAWGRRRNPDNWTYNNIPSTIFSRGYTGHEHLDLFDLINMNGRMYDPILGRFLSPDKFVQNTSYSQGYNRYSYGLNNPLLYADPSGWKAALMDEYWNLGKEITNFTSFSCGNPYGGSRRSGGFGGSSGGNYVLPGKGGNGTGLNGVYYDWESKTYRSTNKGNAEVGWGIASSILYTAVQAQYWIDKFNNETGNGDPGLTASLDGVGVAQGGGVRPSFSTLQANYPGDKYTSPQVYQMIGGKVYQNYLQDPKGYANSCALRMSYALNKSGATIPYVKDQTGSGSDGSWNFYLVADLSIYLNKTYGAADINGTNRSSFTGHQGIIQFDVSGWDDATGHFTIWDGNNVGHGDYFNISSGVHLWSFP